ncbi:MAG TPA: DUF397 domain-containing protein [Pseudonocardiaceae bacterium]|jgi:hypothetical protein|nr:DUF397 domain-containing protein [Pseudonocardiaceae bacterium]
MDTGWFKSSYSNAGGDQCVEVRMRLGEGATVRDSKAPTRGIRVDSRAWTAFIENVSGAPIHRS